MAEAVASDIATERRLPVRHAREPSTTRLARKLGLRRIETSELCITRRRHGRGFAYVAPDGTRLRDPKTVRRLSSLAVPPAYEDVLYAEDPAAHIQAVGRDAAGRLQYRYHPAWVNVREQRKARRLTRLVESLPRIRRAVGQHLAGAGPTRSFALAAVIELVALTAIRSGSESYARERGTRGAATLLKRNVTVTGETLTLAFRAKGGKDVTKQARAPRLVTALEVLRALPGRRLFQYRDESGTVRQVKAHDVNAFLRELAEVDISLKDFRTLCASAAVLETLARTVPADSGRKRRRQVREAVAAAAETLANTPAICRKSYVHETVVTAFENGVLERFAVTLKGCRSNARREQFLAQVVAGVAA